MRELQPSAHATGKSAKQVMLTLQWAYVEEGSAQRI